MLDDHCYNDYTGIMARSISTEIKQTKPFSSLEEEASLALQRTADEIQWRLADMLKPYGISPTQYNALRILRGAGAQGLPCREIGERMINRDPDITRLLHRLEHRKFVARGRGPKDRRMVLARITPAGFDLLKKLDRPVENFHRELLGHMGESPLQMLIGLLELARG